MTHALDWPFRIACDSLVALGNSTHDGNTLFAKNSDRPAMEAQPLTLVPAARHAPGASVRCTYIEIPQVAATARVLGSRPYWCWGFEHGLNEHGVVIGNHTIFTKDQPGGVGLIGMDLLRLALERAASAEAAVEVICGLVETYGQGGSGFADKDWAYNNSFLIADRTHAFVLETSDRHWVRHRVRDVASLSNHASVGTDWDRTSTGLLGHAVEQGWWPAQATQRFDFAAAYRDTSLVPEAISSGRYERTCGLLGSNRGHLDVATLRGALRDHYGDLLPSRDISALRPIDVSVCMHAEPIGTTTASVVAALPQDDEAPLIYRASMGSPCSSLFVPLLLDADLPAVFTRGGAEPSADSFWWQCKRLAQWVEADWEARAVDARDLLDAEEHRLEQELATMIECGETDRAGAWAAEAAQRLMATMEGIRERNR